MNKPNLIIVLKKYGNTLLRWAIGIFFATWLSNLLAPLFTGLNEYLISKSINYISATINFIGYILTLNIPVYSIVIFLITIWLIYKIGYKISLSKRQFIILKAEYGSGNTFIDITSRLNDLVVDNKLNVTLSNGIPGIDPTPGTVKYCNIQYNHNNKILNKKVTESQLIDLP